MRTTEKYLSMTECRYEKLSELKSAKGFLNFWNKEFEKVNFSKRKILEKNSFNTMKRWKIFFRNLYNYAMLIASIDK